MRVLLLFRGAPGSGKSTFIDEHGLRPYALSADEIRLQCQSPQQDIWGIDEISLNNEMTTWNILFTLLEVRMKNGEFTVIDATNSKTVEMNRYKELADTYRYRMYIIDFTKLPIDECKRRNQTRPSLKQVPEEVIDKMYARFKTQKIPSGIKVIDPENLDSIYMKKFDMSSYNKIVHIGDIHGCYEPLKEYFKDGLDDNTMYIFCGDYIDRGIQNVEVINFLLEIYNKPNVLLLEGSHEWLLQVFGHGGVTGNREFEFKTRPQLEAAHVDPKAIRNLYRKMGQMAWYTYDDKEIYVTHAGFALPRDNMTTMATIQMVRGVGKYDDYTTVADTFMDNTDSNMYQIFGHRNSKDEPIDMRPRVFNLEGNVEYGGYLRIVELSHDKGFEFKYIKNDVFRMPEAVDNTTKETTENLNSIEDMILKLRQSRLVSEKKFDNNISSFNFNSRAFRDKEWNDQTQKARGLYINTDKMKIVARGYDKFFNINEMPETKFDLLKYKFTFPVTAYVKENGYLGLVSYNEETDDLFITTKSDPTGEYAVWLSNTFYATVPKNKIEELKAYCKDRNVTLVFEHVDMVHDPHIIEYDTPTSLYLLDAIYNDIEYDHIPYEELIELGKEYNLTVKDKAFVLNNWVEFFNWYNEVNAEDYLYKGHHIEGFVLEDANKFMTKAKLYYYTFWKRMRMVAAITIKSGYIKSTGMLTGETDNLFYGFCRKLHDSVETKEERDLIPRDIITLRKMFYKSLGENNVQ